MILLVLAILAKPWPIDTSLYSILPPASSLKEVSDAEKKMSEQSMNQFNILIGHEDFSKACEAADIFDSIFRNDKRLESVKYKVSGETMNEMSEFTYKHRFSMLGDSYIKSLSESEGASFASGEALQRIYGAFGFTDISHLEEDPYLLGAQAFDRVTMQSPLTSSNRLTLKDSRLVANDSTKTFILWSAKLSLDAAGFANENHVLFKMENEIATLEKKFPGLVVAKSGVPFHSYESSKNAQLEITWISTISIILVLVLLIVIFKTVTPIACTLFSIAVAIMAALATTWTAFGEIHIFTFVFGTSIIGVSIDYAIHFFTEWKYSKTNPDGLQVRKHILKGILLGFMTTEFGYLALLMAPFPLLQQMAVFSLSGLASALITILFLYPVLPRAKSSGNHKILQVSFKIAHIYDWYDSLRKPLRIIIPIALCALCIPGLMQLNVHTDLRNLYTMSDSLKQSEALASRLLNFGSTGNYFIIKGNSAEDVLQKEESFRMHLDSAKKDSVLKEYLSVSYFVPSIKKQNESFEIIKQKTQGESLEFLKSLNFENDSLFQKSLLSYKPFTIDDSLPSDWKNLLQMLWIGKIDNSFYSVILPLHVHNAAKLASLAQSSKGIVFVDKMPEINNSLTRLSVISLMLVGITDLIVFIIFIFVYNLKEAFQTVRIPVCASFIVATLFGYMGIDFNFFAIVGIILTLGIGIDYSLFFHESKNHSSTTALAVSLSATTTILSFGTLALSHFTPVSVFGLSIFIGILSCFILSPLAQKK